MDGVKPLLSSVSHYKRLTQLLPYRSYVYLTRRNDYVTLKDYFFRPPDKIKVSYEETRIVTYKKPMAHKVTYRSSDGTGCVSFVQRTSVPTTPTRSPSAKRRDPTCTGDET